MIIFLRLRNEPSAYDLYFISGAWLTSRLFSAGAWLGPVFAPGRITYHRIVGAVLLYLLIALTFVALFIFVGVLILKAFSGIAFEDNAALPSNIIYFSFNSAKAFPPRTSRTITVQHQTVQLNKAAHEGYL